MVSSPSLQANCAVTWSSTTTWRELRNRDAFLPDGLAVTATPRTPAQHLDYIQYSTGSLFELSETRGHTVSTKEHISLVQVYAMN